MADRTDMELDALLISALYGELAPADEARLAAHLESHPADRTALADLTHTRNAVRESRILDAQLDPPQSVSARLLQEAARSSPRKPAARDAETAGWFHRFARAFIAHPAMATTATFVVVVGVAGMLYVRSGERVGEPSARVASQTSAPSVAMDTPAAAPPAAAADQSGSGYGVKLDEAKAPQRTNENAEAAAPSRSAEPKQRDAAAGVSALGAIPRAPMAAPPPPAAPAAPSPKLAKKAGMSGIELRSPPLAPKDFDENQVAGQRERHATTSERPSEATSETELATATDKPRALRAGGAAAPAAPAPAGAPSAAAAASGDLAAGAPPSPPSTADRRFATAVAPANKPTLADGKAADDPALVAWAQKQHERVVSLVRSSKCPAAATAATEIYSRAPDYYAANVANDRSVKPCLSYLNSEREREDRKLAAKRATSESAPAAAPAATKPASTPKPK